METQTLQPNVAVAGKSYGIEMRKNNEGLPWAQLEESDIEPLMNLCVAMHRQLARRLFEVPKMRTVTEMTQIANPNA